MKLKSWLMAFTLVPLAACASMPTPQQRAEQSKRVEAAAGAPVNHINLIQRGFYSWHPVNDHQIVAYLTPTRAYLIDLPSCPGLEHSPGVAITSRMGQVSTTFDAVTPSLVGVPCQIQKIRPLDMKMLNASASASSPEIRVKPRPVQEGPRHPA